ncbi:unnamed protein product [Clonostachys solani]|uniref:Uncharacterized protein n=1 Tax=Clonostachys solani TaxID=160281 RepID=A0A9P0ECK5_9HYPO|nr:unnamed protein product [Clonostachys solani]
MTYDHQRTERATGKDSGLFPRHDAPGGRARCGRGLQDMSKEAVAQLTSILIMPPNETIAYPSEEWLKDQKEKVSNADWPLRRQYSLAATISNLSRSFHMPTRAGRAELCTSHAQLDPRVIHHLKYLIVHLCDQKLERLRDDYHGTPHHPDVISWLDRLECIRSVCLDENGINEQSPMDDEVMEQDPWWSSRPAGTKEDNLINVQSYRVVKMGIRNLLGQNVTRKTTCAACICAAVGGDRSMLADLFAGVRAREMVEKATGPKKKRRRRPKLLRLLKHWARHYDERRQNRIRNDAHHLKPLIAAALEQADRKSGHSGRTMSPSLRSEKDSLVSDPNPLHFPKHTTAGIQEEHLGSTTSRRSWVVPVYLSPHVEEHSDSEDEDPRFQEPFRSNATRKDDCAISEEYAEIIQVDPFQNNRAYVEDYPSSEEDYAELTQADVFLSQKVYTTNLDGLRGSAIPPPLQIRPQQINFPPIDSGHATRKQSWATVSVHTARQSEAGLSPEYYPPPPIPPFPPAETYQRRPVSSVYDAEGGNPPPSPSVATSKLPYAPNGRMISMVDYNPKHLNQQTLRALEGRATIRVGRDSIPSYLFLGGRPP